MSLLKTVVRNLVSVRALESDDLPGLMHLENIEPGRRWFRHGPPGAGPAMPGAWVATISRLVVGFLVYEFRDEEDTEVSGQATGRPHWPGRRGSDPSAGLRVELLDLLVHPDWRRRGVARALLERFAPALPLSGPFRIEAAVPERNLPAQLLLRATGFVAVKILHGLGGEDDLYLMERRLG
jgi:ribosomal protein S18 acetylase RimI-like enzyme